jgi:hypothetical protein
LQPGWLSGGFDFGGSLMALACQFLSRNPRLHPGWMGPTSVFTVSRQSVVGHFPEEGGFIVFFL